MNKCTIAASGMHVVRAARKVSGSGVILAILFAVAVTAAALLLIRFVRWIGEPDYFTPRRREQKIDAWIERILQ